MERTIDRRTMLVLIAAGAAAAALAIREVAAQSTAIRGILRFEGGEHIPEGQIEVSVENLTIPDSSRHQGATTIVSSDGKSKTIVFSLSLPVHSTAGLAQEIVARLERVDGWLIARGSAEFETDSTADITLNKVIY